MVGPIDRHERAAGDRTGKPRAMRDVGLVKFTSEHGGRAWNVAQLMVDAIEVVLEQLDPKRLLCHRVHLVADGPLLLDPRLRNGGINEIVFG